MPPFAVLGRVRALRAPVPPSMLGRVRALRVRGARLSLRSIPFAANGLVHRIERRVRQCRPITTIAAFTHSLDASLRGTPSRPSRNLARPILVGHDGRVRLTLFLERILPISILALALIGAPIMIFSPEGLPRMRAVEKELADVEDDNAQIRREIESLRGNVARLRDDPAAIERIARDNLGLVRQTEVVFQFPVKR